MIFHVFNAFVLPHFLDVHQLERGGADIQSRVDKLEELNQSLTNGLVRLL